MKKITIFLLLLCLALSGCLASSVQPDKGAAALVQTAVVHPPGPLATALQTGSVPPFEHILWIVLENRSYQSVIGNADMPALNRLAKENVLLSHYMAVRHPSLPNYLALIGGDTFNVVNDCTDCFIDHTSLPDLIEQSGRTWKTYQEDMPSPCYVGNKGLYVQKHNPFIYFDPIRLDPARCQRSVAPLSQLTADLQTGQMPDFAFITPNLCHDGHNCGLKEVDQWLQGMAEELQNAAALGNQYLLVITFDEGALTDHQTCCGLGRQAGGQVATVLISPLAHKGFEDDTPLSHYSLLKTVLQAWNLPGLGMTEDAATEAITAPWLP